MIDADLQHLIELTYPEMPSWQRQQIFYSFAASSSSLYKALGSGDGRDIENYPLADTGRVQHAGPCHGVYSVAATV